MPTITTTIDIMTAPDSGFNCFSPIGECPDINTPNGVGDQDGDVGATDFDDGAGGAKFAGGTGLLGLKDRTEALGGTLDVTSPAGAGTTVTARIPLEPGDGGREAQAAIG